jgi:hypothetical protein
LDVYTNIHGGTGGALPPLYKPRSAAPQRAADLDPRLTSGSDERRGLRRGLSRAGLVPGRHAVQRGQRAPARGPLCAADRQKQEARLVSGPRGVHHIASACWSSSGGVSSSSSLISTSSALAIASALDSNGFGDLRIYETAACVSPVCLAKSCCVQPFRRIASLIFVADKICCMIINPLV